MSHAYCSRRLTSLKSNSLCLLIVSAACSIVLTNEPCLMSIVFMRKRAFSFYNWSYMTFLRFMRSKHSSDVMQS